MHKRVQSGGIKENIICIYTSNYDKKYCNKMRIRIFEEDKVKHD